MTSRSNSHRGRFDDRTGLQDEVYGLPDADRDPPSVASQGPEEPVGRILQSLDRLSDRIRTLSTAPAPSQADDWRPPAPRTPVADVGRRRPRGAAGAELQRAIEQIARRRQAFDRAGPDRFPDAEEGGFARTAPAREPHRSPSEPPPQPPHDGRFEEIRAEIGELRRSLDYRETISREDHLAEIRRLGDRLDAVARTSVDARAFATLHEDLQALRQTVSDSAPVAALKALEAGYDEIVRRLDQMRGAIDNPRVIADVVQRMTEVRRLLAQAPTEAHIAALAGKIDEVARRVETADTGDLAALEEQVARLATAVASIDPVPLIAPIDERLGAIAEQVSGLERRLGGIEGIGRMQEALERQAAAMSHLSQRTEQIPRVAHEMERQSAGLDGIARHVDAIPRVVNGMDGLRRTFESDAAEKALLLETIARRLDSVVEQMGQPGSIGAALEEQIADIASRLDRIEGPVDLEAVTALGDRFEALAGAVESRFAAMAEMTAGIDLPAELLDSLARIEEKLGASVTVGSFAVLEAQVADLADSVANIRDLSAPDLSALEASIAGIRDEVSSIGTDGLAAIRAELSRVSDRLDSLPASDLDIAGLERLEARIVEVVRRLDAGPREADLLAKALSRFEDTLGRALLDMRAPVSPPAATADPTALARVQADIQSLRDDLKAGAIRDRELIAAVGDVLDRLNANDLPPPAAFVAGMAPKPAGSPSPAPGFTGEDAANWSEIERTLSATLRPKTASPPPTAPPSAPEAAAAPAPTASASSSAAAAFGARGTGPRAQTGAPAPEPIVDIGGDELDLPLEPGSGKPVRRPPPVGAVPPASARAAEAPSPKPEPSKADFIAAARRAAQAAGAAPVAPPPVEAKTSGAARLLGAIRNRRSGKPVSERAPTAGEPAAGSVRTGPTAAEAFLNTHRTKILAGAAAVAILVLGIRVVTPVLFPEEPSIEMAALVADAEPALPAEPDVSPDAAVAEDAADEIPAASDPDVAEAPAADSAGSGDVPTTVTLQPLPLGPVSSFEDGAGQPPTTGFVAPAADPLAEPTSPPATADVGLPPDAVGPMALRQAAAAGVAAAQFEVAARLTEGRGVPQDLAEAVRWYRLAADNGLAPAQYRLASLYEKGQGVPRDPRLAADLYRQAAEAGNIKAMHNLAVLNAEGQLGEADYDAAARWFEAAADHGIRDSQYNLGILYAKGLGVPRDLTASYKWFAIAAQSGDTDAAKKRDDIAQVLDRDALARARLAVETWAAEMPAPAANEVDTSDPSWTASPDQTASLATGSLPSGDPIATAQALLTRRGYDAGPADGRIGKKTREAIEAFQRARGLPVTGSVDVTLLAALADQQI